MSAELEPQGFRTYGGWARPTSPGIGPLKLIPTIALMAGMVVALLTAMLFGLGAAMAVAVLLGLAGAPAVVPWRGRTRSRHGPGGGRGAGTCARARHLYRSGWAGVSPDGMRRLPGVLARVGCGRPRTRWTARSRWWKSRQARQWAVVIRAAAQSGALVDPETRDVWVAGWGEWLAHLGQESGVVQATVVVETAPDEGALLAAHVAALVRPDTPGFARAVLADSAAELPTGVAETSAIVTLTFSERGIGVTRARDDRAAAQAAAEEIGRRLPGLNGDAAGGGRLDGRAADLRAAVPAGPGGLRPGDARPSSPRRRPPGNRSRSGGGTPGRPARRRRGTATATTRACRGPMRRCSRRPARSATP